MLSRDLNTTPISPKIWQEDCWLRLVLNYEKFSFDFPADVTDEVPEIVDCYPVYVW